MKTFMFLLALVLISSISVFSQGIVQGNYDYIVTAAATGLNLDPGGIEVGPLYTGVCYEIVPDPQGLLASGGITPVTVDEVAAFTPALITGDPLANVMVSCAVPSLLLSDDGFAPLALTYGATSGLMNYVADGNATFFNPTAGPVDITLATDGIVEVWIGFNTCIPKNGLPFAGWTGQGLISVQYK